MKVNRTFYLYEYIRLSTINTHTHRELCFFRLRCIHIITVTPLGIKEWICGTDSDTRVYLTVPFITGFLRNVTLWCTTEFITAAITLPIIMRRCCQQSYKV